MNLILLAYASFNVAIVVWFFILEPRRIEREYEQKLKAIYERQKESRSR